ncbi:MAG: transcriptional regulator [Planctomycetota bacterium]|nr:MAG: transcriptional regulator [Planctomycetota bacterium]
MPAVVETPRSTVTPIPPNGQQPASPAPAGPVSEAAVQAFAERMLRSFNEAAVTLMTSIGHRTGLFDVLAQRPAATSREIAEAAGLNERYVREWLGAMTTGGIVELDPATHRYWLPPERAACLTRAASPNNLASVAQWFSVLGRVEDQVVAAFKHGRGVPYAAYERFHEVMAEESGQTVVAALDQHIIPLVPGLAQRLEQGIDVVDVGCGQGRALVHLAERFPRSRFTGVDISAEAIAAGAATSAERGLGNVAFRVLDAAAWEAREAFDLVLAFDAIHDQSAPAAVLRNIRQALRPGGVFLMQDIAAASCHHGNLDHPVGPFIYTISCMHCMSVSLAGGGPGLGAAWGKELALEMLAEAGFARVSVEQLPHDVLNYYYVAWPEDNRLQGAASEART